MRDWRDLDVDDLQKRLDDEKSRNDAFEQRLQRLERQIEERNKV